MSLITWGVDGYGVRHYCCRHCELYFGPVDPDQITHDCDTIKPKYQNRGKHDTRTASKSPGDHANGVSPAAKKMDKDHDR